MVIDSNRQYFWLKSIATDLVLLFFSPSFNQCKSIPSITNDYRWFQHIINPPIDSYWLLRHKDKKYNLKSVRQHAVHRRQSKVSPVSVSASPWTQVKACQWAHEARASAWSERHTSLRAMRVRWSIVLYVRVSERLSTRGCTRMQSGPDCPVKCQNGYAGRTRLVNHWNIGQKHALTLFSFFTSLPLVFKNHHQAFSNT